MKPNNEIRLLVAEDDFLISQEIGRLLEKIGYQVVGFAQNGEKAIEMAFALQPDLILMDINMPKLGGLEASQLILEKTEIPIIILTSYDSVDLIEKATYIGVSSYLIKPPKADELKRAITAALARFQDLTIELKSSDAFET